MLARLIPVLSACVSLPSLLASVCLLNGACGSLLSLNFVWRELSPELFKFGGVALKIERMIDDKQVLLVTFASLECPIEGASEEEDTVHDHEFVVHMVLGGTVRTHGNTCISQRLAVVSPVGHAFVISDDTYGDALVMHVPHGVG